ncbi:unnamed protein product, partial [Amoebophrya sp. A25]
HRWGSEKPRKRTTIAQLRIAAAVLPRISVLRCAEQHAAACVCVVFTAPGNLWERKEFLTWGIL